VGAESTRPGAFPVQTSIQIERLTRFIADAKKVFGDPVLSKISIDTRDVSVMRAVLDQGVTLINDVSGGTDEIFDLIAAYSGRYVLMHSQGEPQTMQDNPRYADVVGEVAEFLIARTRKMLERGLLRDRIIWDYGIGFGKNTEHNLALLTAQKRIDDLAEQSGVGKYRTLFGVSRKSLIGKLTGREVVDRLAGTLAIHAYLTLRGADILRVHDIGETRDVILVMQALKKYEFSTT